MGCGGSKGISIKEKSKAASPPVEGHPSQMAVEDFENGLLGVTEDRDVWLEDNKNESNLITDSDFPPEESSMYYTSGKYSDEITWLRPSEIVGEGSSPEFITDGATKSDICQGTLGDCWFLSSVATIAQQQNVIKQVVPSQSLYGDNYDGSVWFRFWRFGRWIKVCVDDYLPTKNHSLMFTQTSGDKEFWVALLEKAYAKLHGSFEAIEGGHSMDALVDLTGGTAVKFILEETEDKVKLFRHLWRGFRTGAFLTCSKKSSSLPQSRRADVDTAGLVAGHAYSMTFVAKVAVNDGDECRLVRIRNPWGDSAEWNGKWSDSDEIWSQVDEATKARLNFTEKEDGEFWMEWHDFCEHFDDVTLLTVNPDFDGDGSADSRGFHAMLEGEWIKGATAGGCRNNMKSFSTNPQFMIEFSEADDFDEENDDPESEGKLSVIVGLMQEYRVSAKNKRLKKHQIGFLIYKVNEDTPVPLTYDHFRFNYEEASSGTYIDRREVIDRFDLLPGKYIIVPSTFSPGQASGFLVRAYAQKSITLTPVTSSRNVSSARE